MELRRIAATRYVTPLREGGSLPAVVEADDDGLYVLKFVGAGQGPKALVAEVVAGELARALGFDVPEIAVVELDPVIGRAEPDAEIQDLLLASAGENLGVDFLPGALPFRPPAEPSPSPELAAGIVWFDALVTNVDRTAKNTNLLLWHRNLWMIDHGATLIFHHNWSDDVLKRARKPFPAIKQHVLLRWATEILNIDAELRAMLTPDVIDGVLAAIPDGWLGDEPRFANADDHRAAYRDYLLHRLESPRHWVEDAADAQALSV